HGPGAPCVPGGAHGEVPVRGRGRAGGRLRTAGRLTHRLLVLAQRLVVQGLDGADAAGEPGAGAAVDPDRIEAGKHVAGLVTDADRATELQVRAVRIQREQVALVGTDPHCQRLVAERLPTPERAVVADLGDRFARVLPVQRELLVVGHPGPARAGRKAGNGQHRRNGEGYRLHAFLLARGHIDGPSIANRLPVPRAAVIMPLLHGAPVTWPGSSVGRAGD